MSDLLPNYRITNAPRALNHSYEKAGLVVHDQPIPWNADAVLVEANLRLTTSNTRRAEDYTLHREDSDPIASDSVRPIEGEPSRYSVTFRLPPLTKTQTVVVRWRERELGQLELPLLSREQFVDGLKLNLPTLAVRLGDESIPSKTFVAVQCRGLLAAALLTSPTSLAPLSDLDLAVAFHDQRSDSRQRLAVRLNSTQLAAREALVTVSPTKYPRRPGAWSVSWQLGERELAAQEVKGIGLPQFRKSMRVSGTRYVLRREDGSVTLARSLSSETGNQRVGPCFLVCSREAGMAALCPLRVTARMSGTMKPTLSWEQEVLITDGLAVVAPGVLDASEIAEVVGFELTLQGKSLALLPVRPAPTATFTSEGGFREPVEFDWSSAADAELDQRLGRLLEERFRAN